MRVATTRRAWERWQASAGIWQGWSVCPALLSPTVEPITPLRARRPAASVIADGLVESLRLGGVVLVLDLEPILGVHIAAQLNERLLANAVLLLPRWPYAQATLPVDQLLDALLAQAGRLQRTEHLPNVAFVLDAERGRPIARRSSTDARADNRYQLMAGDLPDLAALRARGMRRIVKLSAA